MRVVFLAARDGDGLRMRIDAVLDELRNRLQWIALRERNDPDRVPVIADAQLAAVSAFRFHTVGLIEMQLDALTRRDRRGHDVNLADEVSHCSEEDSLPRNRPYD
jgi:hypothetical protein